MSKHTVVNKPITKKVHESFIKVPIGDPHDQLAPLKSASYKLAFHNLAFLKSAPLKLVRGSIVYSLPAASVIVLLTLFSPEEISITEILEYLLIL